MMCLESPTNPMMRVIVSYYYRFGILITVVQVSDLRALSDLCKLNGMLLSVDNSIMSPVLSTPLDVGADIVVHSGTKYDTILNSFYRSRLCCHTDFSAGIVM